MTLYDVPTAVLVPFAHWFHFICAPSSLHVFHVGKRHASRPDFEFYGFSELLLSRSPAAPLSDDGNIVLKILCESVAVATSFCFLW